MFHPLALLWTTGLSSRQRLVFCCRSCCGDDTVGLSGYESTTSLQTRCFMLTCSGLAKITQVPFIVKHGVVLAHSLFHNPGSVDHILLEILFPPRYPVDPPFVRVVYPRFAFHTGHVTWGGSLCLETLVNTGTAGGYHASYTMETLMCMILFNMTSDTAGTAIQQGRVDFVREREFDRLDYSLEEGAHSSQFVERCKRTTCSSLYAQGLIILSVLRISTPGCRKLTQFGYEWGLALPVRGQS
jgi:hypothetical protein